MPGTTAVERGGNPRGKKIPRIPTSPLSSIALASLQQRHFSPFLFPFLLLEAVNYLSVHWYFIHCSFWPCSKSPEYHSFFPPPCCSFFISPVHLPLPWGFFISTAPGWRTHGQQHPARLISAMFLLGHSLLALGFCPLGMNGTYPFFCRLQTPKCISTAYKSQRSPAHHSLSRAALQPCPSWALAG